MLWNPTDPPCDDVAGEAGGEEADDERHHPEQGLGLGGPHRAGLRSAVPEHGPLKDRAARTEIKQGLLEVKSDRASQRSSHPASDLIGKDGKGSGKGFGIQEHHHTSPDG